MEPVNITAETSDDVILTRLDWEDAFALSQIPVGTAITIQNKTTDYVRVFIKGDKPSNSLKDGIDILPTQSAIIAASLPGCWISGYGPVNIRRT